MARVLLFLHVLVCVIATLQCHKYPVDLHPLLMPNVPVNRAELYLCTAVKVDSSKKYFIVGFEPNATMRTVHHIIISGCMSPGSQKPVWNCGEMSKTDKSLETAGPCSQGTQIIYAWAKDAPTLELPEDVGFEIGGDSPIQYLVLQVHYAHKLPDGTLDNSGVILHHTIQQMSKQAGVLVLGTAGSIPAKSTTHMEAACWMRENKVVHPFAYRTHTHSLGTVVAGYKIRHEEGKPDAWVLLGKRSPQTPQMFYAVMNNETIVYGDQLAARCTMKSNRDRVTNVGGTNEDEMCNFYLMYWVENDTPLTQKMCFSSGPPNYYWSTAKDVNNIPDTDASTL